jgi:phage gp36-like protein
MVQALPYTYTTEAELRLLMSQDMVDDFGTDEVGDTAGTITTRVTEAVEEATDTINLYCYPLHAQQKLADNKMVRRWATYLAAYFLTKRRAEPGRYQQDHDRVIAMLERVKTGEMQLPRLAVVPENVPTVTNHVINDNFDVVRQRVERQSSQGTHYPGQPVDPTFTPFE